MNTITPIRVVIADDSPGIRRSFRTLLRGDDRFTVVGDASNGAEAISLARATQPDVVLMDVQMPVIDGIAATSAILAATTQTKVLIVTTFDLDEYLFEALKAGATGFLLKNAPPKEIVRGIMTVHEGLAMLSPEATARMIGEYAKVAPSSASPLNNGVLSERELEVTTLIGYGHSNASIAQELHLSIETVKTYVSRILAKLDIRDRTQLAVLAYEAGLITTRR